MVQLLVLSWLYLSMQLQAASGRSGRLNEKAIKAGEVYVIPILSLWGLESLCTFPPYHAMFAISSTQFFNVVPLKGDMTLTKPRIMMKETYNLSKGRRIYPNTSRTLLPVWKGVILALRMADLTLPYRHHRCNCRHYVDYVRYGRTYGSWLNPSYYPISDGCPLHAPIKANTDVNAPDFHLMDKKGTVYNLQPPIRFAYT